MLSLLCPLSHLGTEKDPHFADGETKGGRGVTFVMYPTTIFAWGWHLLEITTDKQEVSLTEELW